MDDIYQLQSQNQKANTKRGKLNKSAASDKHPSLTSFIKNFPGFKGENSHRIHSNLINLSKVTGRMISL